MRTAVAAGATGLLAATGAAVGFQQMAPAGQPESTASTTAEPAVVEPVAKKQKPRVKVRFERCPRGFVLKGRACVRDVERTVVVDVPGQPATPAPPAQPQPVSQPVQQPSDDDEYGDDDGYEGGQGDDDGYEGEHGDDDGDEGEYDDDGDGEDHDEDEVEHDDDEDEDGEDHDEGDHEDEPEDD